jgi:hypothetical protein
MDWSKLSQIAYRLGDRMSEWAMRAEQSHDSQDSQDNQDSHDYEQGQGASASQEHELAWNEPAWNAWDAKDLLAQEAAVARAIATEAQRSATTAEGGGASFATSPFARMWYLMRERGEHDCGDALHVLYTQRAHPGGAYPDPRGPVAFSPRAIISIAARLAGVELWPVPTDQEGTPQTGATTVNGHAVWIVTYESKTHAGGSGSSLSSPSSLTNLTVSAPAQLGRRKPTIALLQPEEEELMIWFASCALGFIALYPSILTDPAMPPGIKLLPAEPLQLALIHRYAHALMGVEFNCSDAFGCSCHAIEARLNAAPPDHEQPTLTIPVQRVTPVIEPLTQPRPQLPHATSPQLYPKRLWESESPQSPSQAQSRGSTSETKTEGRSSERDQTQQPPAQQTEPQRQRQRETPPL